MKTTLDNSDSSNDKELVDKFKKEYKFFIFSLFDAMLDMYNESKKLETLQEIKIFCEKDKSIWKGFNADK
jgi:hypothetical protein